MYPESQRKKCSKLDRVYSQVFFEGQVNHVHFCSDLDPPMRINKAIEVLKKINPDNVLLVAASTFGVDPESFVEKVLLKRFYDQDGKYNHGIKLVVNLDPLAHYCDRDNTGMLDFRFTSGYIVLHKLNETEERWFDDIGVDTGIQVYVMDHHDHSGEPSEEDYKMFWLEVLDETC